MEVFMNRFRSWRNMVVGGLGMVVFGALSIFVSGPVIIATLGAAALCTMITVKNAAELSNPLPDEREPVHGSSYRRLSDAIPLEPVRASSSPARAQQSPARRKSSFWSRLVSGRSAAPTPEASAPRPSYKG